MASIEEDLNKVDIICDKIFEAMCNERGDVIMAAFQHAMTIFIAQTSLTQETIDKDMQKFASLVIKGVKEIREAVEEEAKH